MTHPDRIGKYAISAVLGKGSMGSVYKGFDPHIQRTVAIKVIHKELMGDSGAQDSMAARFRNEAQAVGRIMHPGVVAIYEFGEDETTAFIAMEYVQGRNLDDIIAATPMLPQEQVLRIMDQLLDALGHAHAQGVWHRDVKPANLILTSGGQVKLTDFGIARISDANLTKVSSAIGTPSYMAPEQFKGVGVDQRADLFACGVVLYRLLTGKRPFTGSADVVMYKILNEEPLPPSVATAGVRPQVFDAVVARAIAKRADDRFQSADEMRAALRAIADAAVGTRDPSGDFDATQLLTNLPDVDSAYKAARSDITHPSLPNPLRGGTAFGSPSPAGTGLGSSSTGIALSGWDPAELGRIERALASHVGPMARLMVREAARSCADTASLVTAVARHIPEDRKRQQFLEVAHGGSQARALGSGVRPPTGGTGQTPVPAPQGTAAAADPLTDAYKAHALQVLTRRMGPIAKVMVKRASDQSGGEKARFVHLLLDAVADPDRTGVQRDLDA